MATASDVLRVARAEVGYCRHDDPERGTKYGRWYESEVDGPGGYDYGASGVAYCAMFVSWVLAEAGVGCAGFPGAYCPSIHREQTLKASQLRAGDVVLFDWEDDGTDDHVGIVASNDAAAKSVRTVEGNTSGGRVAERVRAYSSICGGIRPRYDGAQAAGEAGARAVTRELVEAVADGGYGNDPGRSRRLAAAGYDPEAVRAAVNAYLRGESFGSARPAAPKPAASTHTAGKLDVDGCWGKLTTAALQRALGTTADGIVSDQYAGYKAKNPGLESSSWEWRSKTGAGSDVIRALQRKVGASVDGCAGDETFRKLQAYLGTPADGRISSPSACVRELQRRLNAGKL